MFVYCGLDKEAFCMRRMAYHTRQLKYLFILFVLFQHLILRCIILFFDKKTRCTSRAPYCIEIIINVFCYNKCFLYPAISKKKQFDCTLPCHLIRLSKNIVLNALNVYVYHSVQLHVMIKIIKLQKKDNLCFKLHNCVAKRQIVMLKKGTK